MKVIIRHDLTFVDVKRVSIDNGDLIYFSTFTEQAWDSCSVIEVKKSMEEIVEILLEEIRELKEKLQ